jgi:streptogramin lyase
VFPPKVNVVGLLPTSNRSRRAPAASVGIGTAFAVPIWGAGIALASTTLARFTAGITGSPTQLANGPDGNVWSVEPANRPRIGRITPAGAVQELTRGMTAGFSANGAERCASCGVGWHL